MQALLYIVFILSGAAGLIYESIWSRYLGLFVGHSAYAQIIVLTIFLGGMSVGAFVVGQRSERLKDPLVWYAGVELLVGLIGLVFHDVFLGVTGAAYDTLLPPLAGTPALVAAKWMIASFLILPQSILLGTTFPLMSAGVLRIVRDRPGRVLSMLYFANSLGAAIGVLLAGFYLIRTSGLPGTLLTAAMLNMVVALATFIGYRFWQRASGHVSLADGVSPALPEFATSASPTHWPKSSTLSTEHGAPSASGEHRTQNLWSLLLLLSFGTAVASFIYEIAWIRMLSLVLGSATHSFELMLSAFILGLSIGALTIRHFADRLRNPLRTLGIVQWLMGYAALATLPVYLLSFSWTTSFMSAIDITPAGYNVYTIARYAICLAVMLPSTFFAGMTLPLITRTLIAAGKGERAVGWVYGINTFGSIVGVILAGLVLLPLIGLKALLIVGAAVDMVLGVFMLVISAGQSIARRRTAFIAAGAFVAVTLFAITGIDFDRQLLSSGVYRYGHIPTAAERQMLYYADGRTATVSVGRGSNGNVVYIATNGKPDASLDSTWFTWNDTMPRRPLQGDVSTQVLLPLITLAHAPDARTAAVIGQGSGMSSHFLLGSPNLERLFTIEIEPRMIRGSRFFYPANRRVFDDPRARFVIDDAKSFFAADKRKYDIILSEPSNPWVSGVSGLFTTEFYSRVRDYLSPNGVFGQWLHLYEIDDGLILNVLAAIHRNFQSYEIFLTAATDVLIVASNRPLLPEPDWTVFRYPAVATDLQRTYPFTPGHLEAARLLSRDALAPLLDGYAQPNSDFYPVLDLGAERTRFLRRRAEGFVGIVGERFDMAAPFGGRRQDFSIDPRTPIPGVHRAAALASGAALRTARKAEELDPLSDLDIADAVHRRWRFAAELAAAEPPADWRRWLQDALAVEEDLHAGTAGVADEEFYARVYAFLNRHSAPPMVRAGVDFVHGLAAWDFKQASDASDLLLQPAIDGMTLIPVDALRNGAVVAKLRLGDTAGARKYLSALSSRSKLAAGDLRARLLYSYLVAAEDSVGH